MSGTCSLKAHVRNSQGEVVESKLFNDLLHYAPSREIAKQYYKVGTAREFLDKVQENEKFQTDENGEITFKSLKELAKIDFNTDKLIETLNKDLHSGNYSYEDALKKVQYFNENSAFADKTLATMVPVSGNQYFVSVVSTRKNVADSKGREREEAINSDEQKKLHDVVRNKELEKKILSLLRSHKVSVKFIESEKPGGRYSTENITHAENGLYGLIEINEKGNTTESLAEEAGHFAIGALGEYPLVRRIENLLTDEETRKSALGVEEYNSSNLGTNPAREVAGKLVGKALQRKLSDGSILNTLANRIANLAKRVFYNFTGNEVRWASAKAEQIANKIAYQFVEGSGNFSVKNAINIKETMYNAALSINIPTFRSMFDELGRMCKNLEAISNDTFAKQMQASLGLTAVKASDTAGKTAIQYSQEHLDAMADSLAFDGIVQTIVQMKDYLEVGGQIDRRMQAVDLSNPSEYYNNMARNGRYLRQARVFLRSANIIIDLLSNSIAGNAGRQKLKLGNGMTLNDVKYQDENNNWHSINLKGVITALRATVADRQSKLNALESAYFAGFCENFYGSKYITTTTGLLWKDIWKGKDATGFSTAEQMISIANMVDGEGMHDIDLFHRYLGSMANNPDIIGQIVDKIVKQANKTADDMTLKIQEELIILDERAKKLGINMEDLFERDEEGNYNGNLITAPAQPTENGNEEEDFIFQAYLDELQTDDKNEVYAVDHGKWERARDEFKKKKWEEFKQHHKDWETMSGFTRGWAWDQFFGPEMRDWNKKNSLKVVVKDVQGNTKYVRWVPNRIYKTDAWDNLEKKYKQPKNSKDTINRWMHDYMQVKHKLDSMLPPGATISYRAPQFRGSFGNSVRTKMESEGGMFKHTKAWAKTFGRRVMLESFVETADDQDFGDMTTMNHPDEELLGTKLDFEAERANRLPIFGVNKLNNMTDLSTDLVHSTVAYASMAHSYASLGTVVDALEVGREALLRRKMNPNALQRKGVISIRKPSGEYEVLSTGEKNRAYGRYIKFLDKQVYGIHAPYYGLTVGKGKRILLNKIISNLSSLAGSMFLKYNIQGGAVNTTTGFLNIFKEAMAGDYFSAKDWTKAHQYYWSNWGDMMIGNWAKRRKDDKLSLFLRQMNALSKNREEFKSFYSKRNRINNFGRGIGYSPYSTGDHYMQSMSYLAVANGTKLYDEKGDFSSNLWDAWQKVKNSDAHNEFQKGNTLEFNRFCPLSAKDITMENLSKGVYIKEMSRTTDNFHRWLYSFDPQFIDPGYRSQHIDEYDDFRRKFNERSNQDLVDFQSRQLKMLKGILNKVETYVTKASPFLATPTFENEELQYLTLKNIDTEDLQEVLQKVREDIYNIIWSKVDESNYMDNCREINDRLHGIYNEQDKSAWHNGVYTNAFLAMKGWALGYIEHMFSNNHYNITLGKNVEGFVNTAAKIPLSALLGRKDKTAMTWYDTLLTMVNPWSKRSKKAMLAAGFTEEQHYNARRMAVSVLLILFLKMLHGVCAPPDDEDKEELNGFEGMLYYMSYRALLEQEAFLNPLEAYIQSGSLMEFVPTGAAALIDLVTLGIQGFGAMFADEDNSDYFYQQDDPKDRYEEGDTKFYQHLTRISPWKSWWTLQHPYEAKDNYDFGRKLRNR